MSLPACVAPLADFAIDKMPADEGKQQRIAATYLGRVGPVRMFWPEEDLFTEMAPAHEPAAGFRREQQHGAFRARVVNITDAD